MLTCPRCGTANLKEGCSFSMHLARFCRGPNSIGETPGEKVNHRHKNVDTGSNGGNVNQHKQTRVEVDLNSADQLLWRCPQCSYTNDEEISRAVFGDTDEWAQVCVICYISCPREVNSA
jgi:transposase-like protein